MPFVMGDGVDRLERLRHSTYQRIKADPSVALLLRRRFARSAAQIIASRCNFRPHRQRLIARSVSQHVKNYSLSLWLQRE